MTQLLVQQIQFIMSNQAHYLFHKKTQQAGIRKTIVHGVAWKDTPFEESTYEPLDPVLDKRLIQRFEILESMTYLQKYETSKIVLNNKEIYTKEKKVEEAEQIVESQETKEVIEISEDDEEKENIIDYETRNAKTKRIKQNYSMKGRLNFFKLNEVMGQEQNQNVYKVVRLRESVYKNQIKSLDDWDFGTYEDKVSVFVKINKQSNYILLRELAQQVPQMAFNFLLDNSVLIKS